MSYSWEDELKRNVEEGKFDWLFKEIEDEIRAGRSVPLDWLVGDNKIIELEEGEGNWTAYSPRYPGCIATGQTEKEAATNFFEALEFHLEGLEMTETLDTLSDESLENTEKDLVLNRARYGNKNLLSLFLLGKAIEKAPTEESPPEEKEKTWEEIAAEVMEEHKETWAKLAKL